MTTSAFSTFYRPKKLSEVVGQEVPIQILTNSFNDQSWHHAYLLAGNLGSGKTTVARIMAAMDNCDNGPTLTPCGECRNCKEIFAGKSLDVREIDAASNRGIDDIRDLKKQSYLAPVNSRIKYFIIDEVHSLTGQAAESALKFVEEPPLNVRIILATTDPQKLKNTIHSRCIRLTFNKISWLDLQKHLGNICELEDIKFEDDALRLIAKVAKGSVRDALQGLQSAKSYVGKGNIVDLKSTEKVLGSIDNTVYFDFITNIMNVDVAPAVLTIEKLLVEGKNIETIISGLTEHLRNLLLSRTCGDKISELGLVDEEAKRYSNQSQNISPVVISRMMANMIDVQNAISKNLNPQYYLEKYVLDSIIEVVKSKK